MFGAVWGIGEGLENLAPAVQRFTSFAKQHKELKFFVTAIGCGIAGSPAIFRVYTKLSQIQ